MLPSCLKHYLVLLVFAVRLTQQSPAHSVGLVSENACEKRPALVEVMVVIFMIVQPLSLIVVILYWALDKPIWKHCIVNGGLQQCYDLPTYLSFFVHLYNFLFLFASFLVGKDSVWFIVFAVLYLAWTYINFLWKIGLPGIFRPDCTELGYPLNECPIYDVLDWHHLEKALLLVLGIVLAGFVLIALYRCFAWLRNQVNGSGGKLEE